MSTGQNQYQYLFKVVLVGNSCVGKSSIVVRYADDQFSDVFLATIGVDFRFKSFPLDGNKVKLQIWDTAGHQRFRTITSSYYRGAHALMMVFDITDRGSFQDVLNYWFKQIRNQCPSNTQILLVGNKCDLSDKRTVFQQDIKKISEEFPQLQYIETSAKTSQHIEQAFHKIAGMLVSEQIKKNQSKQRTKKQKTTNNQKQELQKGQNTKLQNKQSSKSNYRQYCCSN